MMEITPPHHPSRSIAARAADGGVIMGGLIMVLTLATGMVYTWPICSVLAWCGIFAVPVLLFFLLQRSYTGSGYSEGIIELWAEGIAIFFLGSLIPALVAYLLLKYVQPDYLVNQVELSIQLLTDMATPESEKLAKTIEEMRDAGGVPTAAQVAAQLIAFNMFIGMILSLIVAFILVLYYSKPERRGVENQ